MRQRAVTILFLTISVVLLATAALSTTTIPANAQVDPTQASCDALGDVTGTGACESGETEVEDTVEGIINILLAVIGFAAVIMLIVGAIRYVISGGDQQAVAAAKNTIIYAIVGIVVAVMAFAIVNFVLERV